MFSSSRSIKKKKGILKPYHKHCKSVFPVFIGFFGRRRKKVGVNKNLEVLQVNQGKHNLFKTHSAPRDLEPRFLTRASSREHRAVGEWGVFRCVAPRSPRLEYYFPEFYIYLLIVSSAIHVYCTQIRRKQIKFKRNVLLVSFLTVRKCMMSVGDALAHGMKPLL